MCGKSGGTQFGDLGSCGRQFSTFFVSEWAWALLFASFGVFASSLSSSVHWPVLFHLLLVIHSISNGPSISSKSGVEGESHSAHLAEAGWGAIRALRTDMPATAPLS